MFLTTALLQFGNSTSIRANMISTPQVNTNDIYCRGIIHNQDLQDQLDNKALKDHTHNFEHEHDEYSYKDHEHSEYALKQDVLEREDFSSMVNHGNHGGHIISFFKQYHNENHLIMMEMKDETFPQVSISTSESILTKLFVKNIRIIGNFIN